MSKLIKARMKWGTAILVGLAVSLLTADDQYYQYQAGSDGLMQRVFGKTQSIPSPLLLLSPKKKKGMMELQAEHQKAERKATCQKDTLGRS